MFMGNLQPQKQFHQLSQINADHFFLIIDFDTDTCSPIHENLPVLTILVFYYRIMVNYL